MEEIVIRPYSESDRQAVRQIAYDTAFFGDSASVFFDDREILQDYLTAYFIDYEPQSCFVAEADSGIVGYLMGAKDSRARRRGLASRLLFKAIRHNIILRKKSAVFIFSCLKSFFKGEFRAPDFSCRYPATLHINIKPGFRNQGIGSRLIAAYLDYLKREEITGLHFATLSEQAARLYERLGFSLLYKSCRSYFRPILQRDIFCYVYGKKL